MHSSTHAQQHTGLRDTCEKHSPQPCLPQVPLCHHILGWRGGAVPRLVSALLWLWLQARSMRMEMTKVGGGIKVVHCAWKGVQVTDFNKKE